MPVTITPAVGKGDMLKSDYDPDENGVVDKAEAPRSGTEFPVGANPGEIFYRTDLKEFYILIET